MKFVVAALALSQLLSQVHGGGEGFTYFETGGLGPNNWATLSVDANQCGGTLGQSTFGQSPVTIDEATGSSCNTGMSQYSFTGGDCKWSDLEFSINNGGELCQRRDGRVSNDLEFVPKVLTFLSLFFVFRCQIRESRRLLLRNHEHSSLSQQV